MRWVWSSREEWKFELKQTWSLNIIKGGTGGGGQKTRKQEKTKPLPPFFFDQIIFKILTWFSICDNLLIE